MKLGTSTSPADACSGVAVGAKDEQTHLLTGVGDASCVPPTARPPHPNGQAGGRAGPLAQNVAAAAPRRPILGASVSGFSAHFVRALLAPHLPEQLDRLRAEIAAGRVHPDYLEQASRAWSAIQTAADEWLTWRSAVDGNTAITGPHPQAASVTITTKEAGTMLGLKERRIRQMLAEGRLAGTQTGRVWLVDQASVSVLAATRGAA
ncbi:hypothetical protein [Actinomadura sp. NTSP31]|uniref:hypothetical protein n=1 Tax=Actinomadura sp. NTSP31 TaxID=1735447 RepID=UPI0035BFABC6